MTVDILDHQHSGKVIAYVNTKCAFLIVVGQVPNGSISDDLKDQLADAALHTSKAFAAVRKGRDDDPSAILPGFDVLGGGEKSKEEEKAMSPEIAIMQPILRFLQLLCENHNRELQVGVSHMYITCLACGSAQTRAQCHGSASRRIM